MRIVELRSVECELYDHSSGLHSMLRLALWALLLGLFQTLVAKDALFASDIEEFKEGAVQRLELEGLPKAGLTDFKITFPLSWRAMESRRDGVVTRISSNGGRGPESAVIWVKQIYERSKDISEEEWSDFIRKFRLPDAKMLEKKRITVDGFDGAKLVYNIRERMGPFTLDANVTNYVFFQNGAMVQLQFGVKHGDTGRETKERIAAFKPLIAEFMKRLEL